MNSLFRSSRLATSNVMETIMRPLEWTKRPARWLMAAGLALGLGQTPAFAEDLAIPLTNNILQLETPKAPVKEPTVDQVPGGDKIPLEDGKPTPPQNNKLQFTKTGKQVSCDYVEYTLHFSVTQPASNWADPTAAEKLAKTPLDLSDQLAPGLSVVSAIISGDVTDAAGTGAPSAAISTGGSPNDTATIADFRLSSSDLDGDGSVETRSFTVKIMAKIDHAAFPAATSVDNQAMLQVSRPIGAPIVLPSQDPALPDDGNFLTGEKTKITIDVTKCTPPGGGDKPQEACFKVDTGTVDCDKDGAGAFIYHMTVGADMAGRVIELSTTNPGVTISPNAQVVPAGGGVLNWTITGAMPGDVVHIVVVGTETFAGPEEGWGICCTQTIEIIIPKDLDCPKKRPDIKVEKKADVMTCTPAGGCKFTIRVSNVGDGPYNGPIVLNEVTLPFAATIDGGPNAPWVCAPMTSPMLCKHPATTLNPGEFIDLKLSFKPGPGWDARYIKNCAKYNYNESGKLPFGDPLNDRACASIDICDPQGSAAQNKECQPPVEKKADLQLRKIAREFCTADGQCLYGILVTNVGTDTYNGPLTVIDEFPGNEPTSVTFQPTPPWNCASIGANQFQCDHPGIVLVPGASTPIIVKAIVPTDLRDPDIENCATVKEIPTETNLANNKACATAKLRQPDGKPALRITKVCQSGAVGAAVSCRITVISVGTSAPVGPVNVSDAATIIGSGAATNITSVTPDGAEWSCTAVPAPNLSCQIPGAIMTPGTSRHFDVTVQVGGNDRFENCARGSFGPAPGDDQVYPIGEACDKGGTDITVNKTGDKQCEVGQPCSFTITVTNNGDSAYNGPVQIGDAIELEGIGRLEGVAIQSVEPPFGCAPEPSVMPFGCTATVSIPAGASQPHVVTVVIPDSEALANVTPNGVSGRNCVAVTGEPVTIGAAGRSALGQIDRGENRGVSCHPFILVKTEIEKQCSEGFVKKGDRCVCPEGTTFSQGRGRCVGETTEPKEPDQPQTTPLCRLLPGMIRTQNGNCVCPRGTDLVKGACRKPPVVQQCQLLPGMIRTTDNRCICPRGTDLVRGACRKPPVVQQCKLLPGMIRTQNGNCICPRGTILGKRGCFKPEIQPRECRLLPGQIRTKAGLCVCPRGTVLGKRGCVKIEQPQAQCPRGTRLINGECLAPTRDPQVQRCPRGTIGVFPVCVDPNQIPKRRVPTIEQRQPTTDLQTPGLLVPKKN